MLNPYASTPLVALCQIVLQTSHQCDHWVCHVCWWVILWWSWCWYVSTWLQKSQSIMCEYDMLNALYCMCVSMCQVMSICNTWWCYFSLSCKIDTYICTTNTHQTSYKLHIHTRSYICITAIHVHAPLCAHPSTALSSSTYPPCSPSAAAIHSQWWWNQWWRLWKWQWKGRPTMRTCGVQFPCIE